MASTPLPTADQISALTEAFRRDPASAYVELGEKLLALGRPRDAVEVGARGLKVDGQNLRGRVMVATAFAQLHQWKEAQAELLKVVKADRNNGAGFRLLGEVLMRRNDYERALPVLQHAQNLNPSDPAILALVRRARSGQPLDPPAPIPTPLQPARGPAARGFDEELPTNVAYGASQPPARPAPGAMPMAPAPPRMPLTSPPSAVAPMPQPPAPAAPAPMASPRPTPSAPGAPGAPGGAPKVRPRVMPSEKPKDAAQASLRESAAVGEQYLNQLLYGGLLEVPNVRVAETSYDVAPGKKWGRSTRGMFIGLFVILFAAGSGGGVWYWYTNKQIAQDVDRHLETAKALVESGDRADLAKAIVEVRAALERDKSRSYTMAILAELTSLSSLLYGEYSPEEIGRAISTVERSVKEPGDKGYRELVIAKASATLASLPTLGEGADSALADTTSSLADWLERSPDDGLARWLLGRAQLAAGKRSAAKASLEQAHKNGEGPVIAAIELANFHLDEGSFQDAMDLYDAALQRSQNHALAFVGRSLARSEQRVEVEDAMADISIGLAQAKGARILAWKQLALASAHRNLEDYEQSAQALALATGVEVPRFTVRVARHKLEQGKVVAAAELRSNIRWYAADPEDHPLVTLMDLELLLARGLPEAALESLEKADGGESLWALSLKGRALFDLRRYADAQKVFEEVLELSPDDAESTVWLEASKMVANKGDARRKADETLDSLGRKAKNKAPRLLHGTALLATGKKRIARDKLEQSVDEISTEYPNPLAYRSYLMLAAMDVAEGKTDTARELLDKALEQNPGYLPVRDLMGQLLVETAPEEALEHLADVVDAGAASANADAALAVAIMKTGNDKNVALESLRRAKERGASTEWLQRAIAAVDPALFEELGVPAPAPEEE